MDSAARGRLGAQFEGLFLAQILKPLVALCGQAGDVAVQALGQSLADCDKHGFGEIVARALQMQDVHGSR